MTNFEPGALAPGGSTATLTPTTTAQPPAIAGAAGNPSPLAVIAAANAAPGTDPATQVGLGSLGPQVNVVQQSHIAEAFSQAVKLAQNLQSHPLAYQQQVWNLLGPQTQRMIQGAGYNPPQAWQTEGGIGGFLSHAWHDVAGAYDTVSSESMHGLSEFLHAAGWAQSQVNHVFTMFNYLGRAAAEARGETGGSLSGVSLNPWTAAHQVGNVHPALLDSGVWAHQLDPGNWASAWRATQHGETTFDPAVVRGLSRQLNPMEMYVAKQLAAGVDPNTVAQHFQGAAQQTVTQLLASPSPEFQQAVNALKNSTISLGRAIVGEQALGSSSEPGNLSPSSFFDLTPAQQLSGVLDGAWDWWSDPTIFGAKIAHAREFARYGIKTADDVRSVFQAEPRVQRAMQSIADSIQKGGADELMRRWPRLGAAVDQLVRANPRTAEDVREWFAGQAGMRAILEGRAGMYYRNAQIAGILPHVSRLSDAMLGGKVAMSHVIDWLADSPKEIVNALAPDGSRMLLGRRVIDRTGPDGEVYQVLQKKRIIDLSSYEPGKFAQATGRGLRRLTTLTPISTKLDPLSHDSTTVIQRFAKTFLPAARAADITNAWSVASDLGKRREILSGLIRETFNAAGMDLTPEGQKYAAEWLADMDEGMTKRHYSINGIDRIPLGTGGERNALDTTGILESHLMQEHWSIPSFRDLYGLAKKSLVMRGLNATMDNRALDWSMEHIWKPSMLLRFGFALRAGGDELANAIFRHGITWYAQTHAARSVMKASHEDFRNWLEAQQTHPLARIFRALTDHLPPEWVQSMRNGKDLVVGVLANQYRRATINVAGRLAGERLIQAYERLYDKGVLDGQFADLVSAAHGNAGGYAETPEGLEFLTRKGFGGQAFRFVPNGAFKQFKRGDEKFGYVYRNMLDQLAESPAARAAIEAGGADLARAPMVKAVDDMLKSDAYDFIRSRSVRMQRLRDGRVVGQDATEEEARKDWANTIVDHVQAILRSPDRSHVRMDDGQTLGDYLLANRAGPPVPDLQAMEGRLPLAATGRDLVPYAPNALDKFVGKGFYHIVSRPMNFISREPVFVHNYANAFDAAMAHLRNMTGAADKDLIDRAHDMAVERAVRETVPFVHNPAIRSQMAVIGRNVAPFYFAQEQFWKRWARVARFAPESFRKAQLSLQGMRSGGFLHTDQNGQGYFYYPATGFLQHFVHDTIGKLLGENAAFLPVPSDFSGQIRFIAPGLDRVAPSVGPLVSVPITALSRLFPELVPTRDAIIGQQGAHTPIWKQLVPTVASRLYEAMTATPESSATMFDMMIKAAQYLETTGHGLPANYTPEQFSVWQDQVITQARNLMVLQAFEGFVDPASPQIQTDSLGLTSQLSQLLSDGIPYDQAVVQFIKNHPDAAAYTTSSTQTTGGGFLPATDAAMHWIDANKSFLDRHPDAASWLIPQTTGQGPFSDAAYQEQLAMGLRTRVGGRQGEAGGNFSTWYQNVKYTETATRYYAVETAVKQLKVQYPSAISQITHWWDTWSAGVKAANPIFADRVDSQQSHARRLQVIGQMQQALNDPNLPESPTTQAVRELMNGYDQVQQFAASTAGSSSYRSERAQLKAAYTAWAQNYIITNPLAAPYWNGVLMFEVPG